MPERNKPISGNLLTDSSLDYQFAWRWLLPAASRQQSIAAFGLSSAEKTFWQTRGFDTGTADDNTGLDGLLLNLDNVTIDELNNLPATHWVAAWGNGYAVQRFQHMLAGFPDQRCYALLPAGQPRVVVPLNSSATATAALRLHRPGRKVARLALMAVSLLARFGFYWPLQKKTLLIASRQADFFPCGAVKAGIMPDSAAVDYALYLGTAEADRKTVALPLPLSDQPSIIKYGDNPLACAGLRNEASALNRMHETLLARQVPAVISFYDDGVAVSLVQAYRPRRHASSKAMQRAVQSFLCALDKVDASQVTLDGYLAGLQPGTSPAMLQLKKKLDLLPGNTTVRLHRSHGDFAPWNCAWTRQGLFVFDWEASTAEGLALADAFYYVLAPLLLVQQTEDGEQALQAIQAFITPLLVSLGITGDDWKLYLALWLIGQRASPKLYCNIASALDNSWL